MTERYLRIIEENRRLELEAPYNFCDRWCEQCQGEVRLRCKLYRDEQEAELTNIAHGIDPEDPEIMERIMAERMEGVDDALAAAVDEPEPDEREMEECMVAAKERRRRIFDDPLYAVCDKYTWEAFVFIDQSYIHAGPYVPRDIADQFEVLDWYHGLLQAKMYRALDGLLDKDDEYSLADAVAQLAVCKKAIGRSAAALQALMPAFPNKRQHLNNLRAMLFNIQDRIELIERGI